MNSLPTVLIVDDEVRGLETLQRILQDDFDVQIAENVKQATEILENEWVQIILCDQRMPDITGVEFLKQVRDQWPEVIRMIISGYTDSEDIISAVNDAGIYQFITKPWHPDSLILLLKNAAELFDLQRKNEILSIELKMSPTRLQAAMDKKRKRLRDEYQCEDQIVRSPQSCMNQVCEKIRRVSPYDVSVLLTGESGTGKELAARALHYNSTRWDQPFVVENCGALPDELLESELFGYKRGAFTGAVEDRAGLFERASGGTVFLDEIGEVSPAFQVKLLRVLQEGEIRPLGSSQTRQVDVRVIAATNRDLEQEVREGRFREDLYYRLATVTIHLPALRERKTDIPLIANSILDGAIQHLGKRVDGFSAEAIACMQAYHWPGNVRELQNEIRHMLVMSDMDEMGAELLSPRVLRAAPEGDEADLQTMDVLEGSLKERVESLEARILKETLIRHRWNKSQAAKELGLSRVGLRSKLERYGLEKVEQLRDQDERDVVG
ncbi:MAG: sigma-54 dependent transcriptional regulator [Candidatus Thiodiazotropha sp. (ex Lucinoma kastoroae)]|nr:sigma-54 dependent transcriptional regulator [Candidatus Thiodiazotropha sp. (ex Lucinoma kastoroae)]MCU7860293.1 sigma-54 dependent transcriptional regulator [Candidatus Thiodiazotropha sp. (ex Lucinoma kastoroae)]